MLATGKPSFGFKSRTRAGHAFHECGDAEAFGRAFQQHWGVRPEQLVAELVPEVSAEAIVLVGSIPFGIGSAGSDIDLAILARAEDFVVDPRPADGTQVIYCGRYPGARGEMELANLLIKRNGVEIDILFMDIDAIATLTRQIDTGDTALTREQTQLIGRLRAGWLLHGTPAGRQTVDRLRAARSFDLLCTTRFLRNALKDLEHARLAAANGEQALAGYLGRACVEKIARSIFAAGGRIGLSTKWLRLLERPTPAGDAPGWTPVIVAEAVRLLFPPPPTDRVLTPYLDDVGRFYAVVLDKLVQGDMALRLAIDLCPQIYDPCTEEPTT